MSGQDSDALLKRLERRARWFCALAAVVALGVRRGRTDVALGVIGGGLLIGLSYWAIRSSIDGLLALAQPEAGSQPEIGSGRIPGSSEEIRPDPVTRRRRAFGFLLRFVGRYAVLGALAYVMLVWFRLHPVGLMLGVSSIVFAAAMEVVAAPRQRGGLRRG